MSKQPPPAPTASAIGPCPTIIQIVGRPGTGSLPRTIAQPDHPHFSSDCWTKIHHKKKKKKNKKKKALNVFQVFLDYFVWSNQV